MTTVQPTVNATPMARPSFGRKFKFENYDFEPPRLSPSLWLPYFSGNSNKQVKPHSLVILA